MLRSGCGDGVGSCCGGHIECGSGLAPAYVWFVVYGGFLYRFSSAIAGYIPRPTTPKPPLVLTHTPFQGRGSKACKLRIVIQVLLYKTSICLPQEIPLLSATIELTYIQRDRKKYENHSPECSVGGSFSDYIAHHHNSRTGYGSIHRTGADVNFGCLVRRRCSCSWSMEN